MQSARGWLFRQQSPEGWWCGALEGDATLESYLILVYTFLGRPSHPIIPRLAARLRRTAVPSGGWSPYAGGPADLSVSCLAYFALKVAGESADSELMRRAREAILSRGGAARANSYTRYHLAMFGQIDWSDVPAIPPELVFLPGRGPFSIYDMSSWSRTIFVPLSIIYAKRPVCPLPAERGVRELWVDSHVVRRPDGAGAFPQHGKSDRKGARTVAWRRFFLAVDRGLKLAERLPLTPVVRRAAVERAANWMIDRMDDSDGLGAILPAMTSSVIALRCLGHGDESPLLRSGVTELERLFVEDEATGDVRVSPCLSPVWDTCLTLSALIQGGAGPDEQAALGRAARWLLGRECRRTGDWAVKNRAAPGGWAFEFRNAFYPDVDDTAMALMVLRAGRLAEAPNARAAVERGLRWLLGMQNRDGGWASFDRDNDKQWLTHVPFADHNAMIDPSTADITGRVLESLSHFDGYDTRHPVVKRALSFLRGAQEPDGSWFGRWGVNYIYGTWQVLRGLKCIGEDMERTYVRRAARWLTERQNPDGGWGESIASYDDPAQRGIGPSTPSQTAWAVMGLIAAYQTDSQAVRSGVRYLLQQQREDGGWEQPLWTGTGFPRVFYLSYEYYKIYFPLMALGQYHTARFPPRIEPID